MRHHNLGAIPGLPERFSREETLSLFRKTCFSRSFELKLAEVYKTGQIKAPIYLSVGQEHIPAAISVVTTEFLIFAQHRAHSYYLSFGGYVRALIDELLHRKTGCAGGMGGSASIHSPQIGMYGHSGLMGDQVPIAVGAALASKKQVLTVVGDASAEEDYVLGAMGYAASKRARVLFVCEDNDLSILTKVSTRRTWRMASIARSFGMTALEIADDPWLIAHHVRQLLPSLPGFINVHTCRSMWHAGVGTDGPPEWDRFSLIRDELELIGLGPEAENIQNLCDLQAEALWEEQLAKPSAF